MALNANLERPARFRTPALSRCSRRATASCTHKTWVWRCLTLPTPRREATASDAVSSTRTRGSTTLAISRAMAAAPRVLEALLVNTQNSASPELVATRFQVVADEAARCPPSITYEDEVDNRVFAQPAQSLSEKTSTIGCSACLLYTTLHLGLPFRNRTKRLSARTFVAFGCCIRLASSFTANCSSHLFD